DRHSCRFPLQVAFQVFEEPLDPFGGLVFRGAASDCPAVQLAGRLADLACQNGTGRRVAKLPVGVNRAIERLLPERLTAAHGGRVGGHHAIRASGGQRLAP
ncbi:hypothetical protein RZS08_66490, partial [Arthrospira platensis SPKY1]|nr:hypothetical protein [Arthrospira platensis SPKY1]